MHTHEEYVISANLSGIEQLSLHQQTLKVHVGGITLYNPETLHASQFGDRKRLIQTVFYFRRCFLPWTLSRTWTLSWTKIRLTLEESGSPLHSACDLTTP
ncbi:hypothetical protein EWM58_09725 [Candidatus Erwinia dacicola]|nr:AraC family ligand binding domain-containing protein [Candidatus Erwinia dacicola]NJD00282.1 hypothetical protein [Candidatus Erwinia dacicola]